MTNDKWHDLMSSL